MKNTTIKLLNDAVFEALEGRQMMSAAPIGAALNNGVLTVTGSPTESTRVMVDLTAKNSQVTVNISGAHSQFPVSEVKQLNITAGNGDDYIYINPALDIPSEIKVGNGTDSVRGGGGRNTIIAGNGNDILKAEGTDNFIQAGSGNDLLMGHGAHTTLIAGDGNDYLTSLGRGDQLTGGNGNDTFVGGGGNDTIRYGSGHNVMSGGLGNSYLYTKSTSDSGGSTGSSSGGSSTSGSSGGSSTSGKTTNGSNTSSGSTSNGGSTTSGSSGSSGSKSTSGGSSTTTGGSSTTTGGTSGSVGPTLQITVSSKGATAPVAVINTMAGPRFTGNVVNVDALASKVGTGTSITSIFSWDFGDPGSQFNQLSGFNSAHVYDKPGTYGITLTVTNDAGLVSHTTSQVTIAASQRTQIYVDSSAGKDSNRGTANSPLQSLAAAFAQIGNNTEILLKAGDTFYSNASLHVNNTNVLIGRYGTGTNPMIMRTIGGGLSTIGVASNTNGLTIQDITFNSPYPVGANGAANKIGVGGIYLAGQNLTVRDCTFLNVDDAMNENGNPTGVLIQSNDAPLATGVRGYFLWGQGEQDTIIGNFAANSAREHIVRCVGVSEVAVLNNNFTNLNRQSVDKYDSSKGCIEIHRGEYDWIVGNIVADGDIRVGPLGLWGESVTSNTSNCVIEDNQLTNTMVFVNSGTHHALIANNVITNPAGQALVFSGVDAEGRTSQDITIVHNTGIDTGTQGSFLELDGYVNGIVMENNLWVAPKIQIGSYSASPIRVGAASYLSSFSKINANIWPSPSTLGTYAAGGINFVGTSPLGNGYLTAAQWNAESEVGTDMFNSVTLNGTYEVSYDSMLAGASIRIAA